MSTDTNMQFEDGLSAARNGGCKDFSEKTASFISGYHSGEKENRQIAAEEVAGMPNEELCSFWAGLSEEDGVAPDKAGVSFKLWYTLVFDQMCERDLSVVQEG